jgi:type IV secretory pathway ATPase VirB11/archaellum biosynthesis ATPase
VETKNTRKKVPLRSSRDEDNAEIEKKVDEILKARPQVLNRKEQPNTLPENLLTAERKRPSIFSIKRTEKPKPVKQGENEKESKNKHHFFHLQRNEQQPKTKNSKENTQKPQKNVPPRQRNVKNQKKAIPADIPAKEEKDKKPTVVKTKKHIGFKKKKKEIEPKKEKPLVGKKSKKTQESLPQFEESIALVKPDEAVWLDQQIKAIAAPEKQVTAGSTDSTKVEVVMLTDDAKSEKPQHDKNEQAAQKADEKIFTTDTDTTSLGDISLPTDVPSKQPFTEPGQPPTSKEIKIDELIPDGQIKFLKEANFLKAYTLERMGYTETQIEEIDFYPLQEPFAYVEIIREKESLDKRYVLLEMELSKDETYLLKFIRETLTGFAFKTADLETKGENKYLSEKVDLIIDEYMLNIDTLTKKKILYYLEKESIGLGKLEVLMSDPNIEDISCDGSGVFIFLYHRRYGSLKSNIQFNDEDELTAFVVKLAQKCGKHISISEPMLDATMPDGSRIQMTLSTEVTTKGSTFTIRKFSEDPFSPPDLIEFHTMSSEMVAYMWLAVENGVNALIAGGTAAGKTSTLNALCLFIPRESKIVSIEETREINLPHPNWIPGVVRSGFGDVVGNKVIGEIDLYDLMKAALRQRPEYILVGEIRGKEAYVLFQAMATGHTTYSTVHADSAQSLIHRLEGKPIEIPRIMLQTLDVVCIQVISRVKNKRARRCKQIIEIIDIDPTTKEILTNEVFRWDPIEDKFIYSGKSYILERIRAEKDISREGMIGEIKNRTLLLDWMNKNNIREFKKVATVVAQYADNPEEVMKKIRNEP